MDLNLTTRVCFWTVTSVLHRNNVICCISWSLSSLVSFLCQCALAYMLPDPLPHLCVVPNLPSFPVFPFLPDVLLLSFAIASILVFVLLSIHASHPCASQGSAFAPPLPYQFHNKANLKSRPKYKPFRHGHFQKISKKKKKGERWIIMYCSMEFESLTSALSLLKMLTEKNF